MALHLLFSSFLTFSDTTSTKPDIDQNNESSNSFVQESPNPAIIASLNVILIFVITTNIFTAYQTSFSKGAFMGFVIPMNTTIRLPLMETKQT